MLGMDCWTGKDGAVRFLGLAPNPRRRASWRNTIRDQRVRIGRLLRRTPSLRRVMADEEWRADVWIDAVGKAVHEAGLDYSALPVACPWTAAQVEADGFFPD